MYTCCSAREEGCCIVIISPTARLPHWETMLVWQTAFTRAMTAPLRKSSASPPLRLLLLLLLLLLTTGATASSDVTMQFYMLQLEQWTERNMTGQVKAVLSDGARTFCLSRLRACGLSVSADHNFSSADVTFSPGYPKNLNSRYLELAVSIGYSLANGTSINLTSEDVSTIVQAQRAEIYNRIGSYIVYIGTTFFSVPPPNLANWIIVSTFTAITVAMVIAAVVLGHRQSMRELKSQYPAKEIDIAAIPMQQQQQQPADSVADTAAATATSRLTSPGADGPQKQPLMSGSPSQVASAGSENEGFLESLSNADLRQRRSAAQLQQPAPESPTPANNGAAPADVRVISPAASGNKSADSGAKVDC